MFDVVCESSEKIYVMFLDYLVVDDFVGVDMVCKFLQMGFICLCCYVNYKGGKKYDGLVFDDKKGQLGVYGCVELFCQFEDLVKVEFVCIFKVKWDEVEVYEEYVVMKKEWKVKYG